MTSSTMTALQREGDAWDKIQHFYSFIANSVSVTP